MLQTSCMGCETLAEIRRSTMSSTGSPARRQRCLSSRRRSAGSGAELMEIENVGRRSFLKAMGAVGMSSTLPEAAFALHPGDGHILHEVAAAGQEADSKSKYSIKFGVIGLDHYHIMGMTAAVIRGGGELVSFYTNLPKAIPDFQKLYPNAKLARSEEEILEDPS